MEVENCDNIADNNESEAKTERASVPNEKGQMDADEDGESVASVSEQSAETTDTGSTSSELMPELSLVLTGDSSSINIGPKNILIGHNEQTEQFSARLYDLCGRRISVINMLGLKQVPLNEGIHTFVLLVPNGPHAERYRSGLQWIEQTFGKESLSCVLTVVTHDSDENCEGAMTDLRTNSSFDENRFYTCSRGMTDGNEIIELVEKIDSMVSDNHPDCYSRKMIDEHEDQKQQLEGKKNDLSVFQKNQTDDVEGGAAMTQRTNNATENALTMKSLFTSSEANKQGSLHVNIRDPKNEQSVKTSEEIQRSYMQVKLSENKALFDKLQLHDEKKLSPKNILKISPSVKQDHDSSDKGPAQVYLCRLIMLDYRSRYICVGQEDSKPDTQVYTAKVGESEIDAFCNMSLDTNQSTQTHVHPMDVQMAVFLCSDSFLQQNMVTKLSQCQYALPLLVPHPLTGDVQFPLWTFRQIIKTWKTPSTTKSVPVYKAQTPMVSFLRLGSLSVSKSQLMNDLINERHSTFFHRNCAGSTKTRLLMDGVAEITWYCPAGKPNDAFTDCIAFCNLHGDALEFEQQREILVGKSSVNVVLVPTLEKGDKNWTVIETLLKSSKPLICLITDIDCGARKMKEGKYRIGLKGRSQSDVSEKLKRMVGEILSGRHESFQLETLAEVSGLRVDEDDPACRNGKSAAMNVVKLFKGKDVCNIKDEFLRCQGDLWHKWCRINKELYHLKGNIEMEKSKKQQELMQIRRDQCRASCSEVMKLFINGLSSLPSPDKEYFLKWTQILIDALSTDDLCSILQDYDKTWSEVLVLKKKHKSDQLKIKQTELEQISKKLQSATFGLEHIFREMGQIYEAHKCLDKQPEEVLTDWSKYPELAAELMISGHPMELMDGDAGHVPLTWVSSVLDEVRRKLGDCRVFVLSVLGVQSSGKSTMLNAMFGMQFAVSAGRCTKGAFMQLVKVSEEMKRLMKMKFDYVLVVDTEGLRALELEGTNTLHHDNELATFVVGLGNMTLINIFGENPAEMQDVLQIVVQAFMRMKKVRLSPSCVFVHQNVTDITAIEKNMDGKRRLQEKLDQMVQLAAKEEGSDAESFSDIIAFDVQTDVKYFAQLWEGSPPMAPPNPGYSESVQELKDFVLSKASRSDGVTLSQFRGKIQDLWNALLRENFVFSFKNTLEISVYRKLEVQYGNWTWTLRSNMLTIENQLHTRIENGMLDKVESNYLHEEISETYDETKKQMTKYFEDEKDKEILVQWQGRFENKIKDFHDEQVKEVKRKLDEVLQQKKACKNLDNQKTEFENKLLQQSKELAHKLKDKNNDEEELKKQFNCMWRDWVTELTGNTRPIQDINFEDDKFNILQDLGIEWTLIHESKSSDEYKNISKIGDYSKYVFITKQQEQTSCDTSQQLKHKRKDKKGQWVLLKATQAVKSAFGYGSTHQTEPDTSSSLPCEEQICIRSLINYAQQQTQKIIKSKPVATRGYSPTYLQEMAKAVKDKVTEFESQKKYALKKEFTVDLLLFVFDRAERWISESQETFKKNNDAATFVNSKKSQYYNVFRSYCKGSSSAVVLGELICEKLKVSSVEAVCNKTAITLAGDMKCNYPAFSGNRLNLEKHVLKSLADKEDFNDFITYIRNPRQQVENFIKEEVKRYIFTENKDKALEILKKNVEDIKMLVGQALFTATEKVKNEEGDIEMWLKEFSSLLKDNLTFDPICSQNFSDISDFDHLKGEVEIGLTSIVTEISSLSLEKMKDSRLQPDQILIDQLCRCCWVQCPFCAAVCTNTLEDHSPDKHNVPFHRPSGIEGWHVRHSVDLVVDFCTTLVASDRSFYPRHDSEETVPYKQYQNGGEKYASWMITADESKLTYWKWFVCRFQKQLEEYYKLKFQNRGEIPSEWRKLTKQDAIKSLDEMCKE